MVVTVDHQVHVSRFDARHAARAGFDAPFQHGFLGARGRAAGVSERADEHRRSRRARAAGRVDECVQVRVVAVVQEKEVEENRLGPVLQQFGHAALVEAQRRRPHFRVLVQVLVVEQQHGDLFAAGGGVAGRQRGSPHARQAALGAFAKRHPVGHPRHHQPDYDKYPELVAEAGCALGARAVFRHLTSADFAQSSRASM
ncbi:MAG: hypothetical protein ACXW3B_02120 [Telluria sp.]